jgi:HK97 family phage major capsid protein
MKTNFLTRILLFALVGFLVGAAAAQAFELSSEAVKYSAFAGAVSFQYLHFVEVPLGVFSFVAPTTLKGAKEQRGALAKKMRDLLDKIAKENRVFTEQEEKDYSEWDAEFDLVQAELVKLEKVEARNQKLAAALAGGSGSEGGPNGGRQLSEGETRDLSKFSLFRGLALMAEGKQLDGVEAEVHQLAVEEARSSGLKITGFGVPAVLGTAKRGQTVTGQTTNPGDQGGVTVQTDVNGLIEALWSKNFLSLVGATRLSGLIGNQTFPVQITKPAASSRTEIEEDTATEILFSDVDMSPNRRSVTIPISKLLLIQNASFDTQTFVMNQMRKGLDYKLNVDAITAILAAITSGNANLLALGAAGADPVYDNIVDLETLIAASDADKETIKYLTNTKVRGKLKKTQKFSSTNGDPVWEKGNEMNGYPAITSNIVPSNLTKGASSGICSAIVLGNFEDFYVGMWGGMDFVVDPYSAKKKAQIEITVNAFWDTEVARAASFAGIKDALTA